MLSGRPVSGPSLFEPSSDLAVAEGAYGKTAFGFLFYDVTSVYFEGMMEANPQAQYGYSRDHRPDCKHVCVGLVVTREGLPV